MNPLWYVCTLASGRFRRMIELMVILLERIGLLLLVAFMLTQIPGFRSLLDRDIAWDTVFYHALILV